MAISFHPNPGCLLYCDFPADFKKPEMIKRRPVIVISKNFKSRPGLVTIVPLSTVRPEPPQPYHYLMPKKALPMFGDFQVKENWVKGDMIYSVGFHRLDRVQIGRGNKRQYYTRRFGREQMASIYRCVFEGLGYGHLGDHLTPDT